MKFLITLFLLLFVYSAEAKLFPVINSNKSVYIDSTGIVAIQGDFCPQYTKVLKIVNGKELVDIVFNRNAYFHSGLAFVHKPVTFLGLFNIWDNYQFIDTYGRLVFETNYEDVAPYIGGYSSFLVQNNPRQYGVLAPGGEWINLRQIVRYKGVQKDKWVSRVYFLTSFYEGKALTLASDAEESPYTYIYRKDGILTIDDVTFEEADIYSEGLAAFRRDSLWGYMDHDYNIVIDPQFNFANQFTDGYAKVFKDGFYGFINKQGEFSIEAKYEELGNYCEGLVSAKQGEKWGALDIEGNWVIKPQYFSIGECHNGLMAVEKDGKYGYINKQNEFIISPHFDYAEDFDSGIAKAWVYDELYYINTKGSIVWTLLDKDDYNSVLQDIKSASR